MGRIASPLLPQVFTMKTSFPKWLGSTGLLAVLLVCSPADAQFPGFENLPPDQRAKIMEQMQREERQKEEAKRRKRKIWAYLLPLSASNGEGILFIKRVRNIDNLPVTLSFPHSKSK